MSADKRSVFTDALETLGTIIDDSQKRDAIHIAVEPVVAAHRMLAGSHVGRLSDGTYGIQADKHVGIADPFISGFIEKGDRFWLCIYPRQIKSLRHVWSHPDFDDVVDLPTEEDTDHASVEHIAEIAKKTAQNWSKQWIENYCYSLGESYYGTRLEYDVLMSAADDAVEFGSDYVSVGDLLEGRSLDLEFWKHYQIVRDVKLEETPELWFSCSC